MVNAAPETNEGNEANEEVAPEATEVSPSPGSDSRLPLQLSRLPTDKLMKVHQALMELQEAGLSEVPDLSALSRIVKKKTDANDNARLPYEDHTSEYMGMTLWAWTPKRWFENINATGKASGAKSEDAEVQAEDALPPEAADLQSRFDKRIAAFEKWNNGKALEKEKVDIEALRVWFEAMKKATDEVRSLVHMEPNTTQAGDGVGVLFEKLESAGGPRVLPKVRVGGMKEDSGRDIDYKRDKGPVVKVPAAVISVHLGGEGSDVGLLTWQKYMSEHLLDGSCRPQAGDVYGTAAPFFAESTTGRFIPRAILAGYDGGKLDTISQAGIFAPTSFLTGNKPGDTWADGQGDTTFCEEIFESLRRQMEQANFVDGMLFNHNAGEDICMSGVASAFYRKATDEFGKKLKHSVTGVPDAAMEGDLSPYVACTMMSPALLEHLDVVTFYDRTSLRKMASSKVNGLGLSSPDDASCNSLLARLMSGITGPLRFAKAISASEGSRLTTWQSHATNLCSYPRIHFMLPGLGGIVAKGMEDFSIPGQAGQEPGFDAAGSALRRGCLSSCNNRSNGKSIAVSMFCRGVEQGSVIAKVCEIKTDRNFQFVDWSPSGFSIWSYKDPKSTAPEVAILENTTAAKGVFTSFMDGCEAMSGNAGVDGLIGGDSGPEMSECLENVAAICKDYEEVGADTCDDEMEEDGEEY